MIIVVIAVLIVACEISFWVFVLAGLCARYLAGFKRLGAALLLATPIVDLFLLIFTVVDIRNGAKPEFMHGLAAIYVGVTVAYGHRMIKWADERFAYRFAGGAKPVKAPKHGTEHARRERKGWYRHLLAWFIGSILIMLMILIVGDWKRTESLMRVPLSWGGIVAIDFLISFSYTLWPREKR
ncbi:putative membrane protein YmcC [Paenibacillus azoreducens]|uniref:Membrane protein YmcC n=1 Tax=Paenibacillus azoreducens TaxID=116718 RepID=A0A920CR98_9BACL|nr:putative membrane protein YmcC [Paenibacillus azoreducens]